MIPDAFHFERTGADPLIAGHYLVRRGGRVDIPVRIWFGPPVDPETGEELDRSPRWQVQVGFDRLEEEPVRVGGIWIEDLTDVWPSCGRFPVDEADYAYRMERATWSAQYDPDDAHAEVGGRIDPMTCTLP